MKQHTAQSKEVPESDQGSTLIEVLVALMLMGTVLSVAIAGMWTAVRISTFSDEAADLDAVLGSAADALGDETYRACPDKPGVDNEYLQFAQKGADAVDWPASTVTIDKVEYWNPYATSPADQWVAGSGLTVGECNDSAWLSNARTMQKITIRATTPDGERTRTLDLVMTDVRAS